MHTSTTRRLVRTALALALLVLGAGTATVAAPATPALASGSYIMLCFPVYNANGQIIDWVCHPYELPREAEPCVNCPDFALGMDHLVLPADPYYFEDLLRGLDLLGQAAVADPRQAASLRAAAEAAFLAAAERLGDNQVRLGEAGIVDWELNIVRPDPDPWLWAAGTDVGNGLTLMQQALANPEPSPWIQAGMAEFEEAYQEIIQRQPIGR